MGIIREKVGRIYHRLRDPILGKPDLLDRIVMDRETRKLVAQTNFRSASTLEISGDAWKDFGFKRFRVLRYPDFDICSDTMPNETYDLIIAEQVFEHLRHPGRAARNVYNILNPGGHLLITVPFLQKVHNFPIDCFRWTEVGLKAFLSESGFNPDAMLIASWGNASAARANLEKDWPPRYNKLRHSLKNDPAFPVQVWALAKKT